MVICVPNQQSHSTTPPRFLKKQKTKKQMAMNPTKPYAEINAPITVNNGHVIIASFGDQAQIGKRFPFILFKNHAHKISNVFSTSLQDIATRFKTSTTTPLN